MPRLFYKDLRAHEAAYRNNRADEAVNDLILGAKVNTLRNMEQAREQGIEQVANNYGMFLKALKTKNVELVNRANKAEENLATVLEQTVGNATSNIDPMKEAKMQSANVLMPGKRQRSMSEATVASTAPTEEYKIPAYDSVISGALGITEKSHINRVPNDLKEFLGDEKFEQVIKHLKEMKATTASTPPTGMHKAKKEEFKAAIRKLQMK